MKVRNGFVSNSSSSSFCIVGMCVDSEEFEEIQEKLEKPLNWDEYTTGIGDYYEEVIIGESITRMKEDETLAQFKDDIAKWIKERGIDDNPEIDIYIDGGYDG